MTTRNAPRLEAASAESAALVARVLRRTALVLETVAAGGATPRGEPPAETMASVAALLEAQARLLKEELAPSAERQALHPLLLEELKKGQRVRACSPIFYATSGLEVAQGALGTVFQPLLIGLSQVRWDDHEQAILATSHDCLELVT